MKYYIYRITNLIDNKTYVGQRLCPKNKTPETDTYMGSGKIIKLAEKKYGLENFKKEILVKYIPTKERTDDLEVKYIKYERLWHGEENCYNIANGGNGPGTMSDETKIKISEANKGKPKSYETRVKLSAANKGKHPSAETRAKMSATHKGKHRAPMSDETKAKISAAEKGKLTWNKGKHPSDETRAKMSYSASHISDETRAKLSAAAKGKHPSAEARAKMSAARKGKNNPMYGKHWHLDENGKRIYTK